MISGGMLRYAPASILSFLQQTTAFAQSLPENIFKIERKLLNLHAINFIIE